MTLGVPRWECPQYVFEPLCVGRVVRLGDIRIHRRRRHFRYSLLSDLVIPPDLVTPLLPRAAPSRFLHHQRINRPPLLLPSLGIRLFRPFTRDGLVVP